MMTSIDTSFPMHLDTPANKDPDTFSRTLRNYHRLLWTKALPDGNQFELTASEEPPYYLGHKSEAGDFILSSDSIIHTFTRWKRESMARIIRAIPKSENDDFFNLASTIGGYIVFPANRIDQKPTINGIRGIHPMIMDRFDLTLECIRRWYLGLGSPLYEHIDRYRDFFSLFADFQGYVAFFLLNDLVGEDTNTIRFWLPFDEFGKTSPLPKDLETYLEYRKNVSDFVNRRNLQIEGYVKTPKS